MADTRIGLACAGGVVEGAFYEIGALTALEEAVDGLDLTHLDYYVGVSSGALVATFLASGIPVRDMAGAIAGEPGAPMILQPELLFRPDWKEFGERLAKVPRAVLEALMGQMTAPGDKSLVGMAASFGKLIPVGLFDNRPLERFVARMLSEQGASNRFSGLDAELRIVAMDVDSSEIVCFGDEAFRDVPISRAVQASTALPIMYRPVTIDGRSYVDGVARRTVHASRALSDGVKLLFCVNPIVPVRLDQNDESPHLVDAGLPHVLSQTFRTMVHSRMITGFRTYEHSYPDADTILIEPSLEEGALFFSNIFSFANRRAVCEEAYSGTRDWLRAQADTLEPVLARHGLVLNRRALDRSSRLFQDQSSGTDRANRALDRLEDLLARVES